MLLSLRSAIGVHDGDVVILLVNDFLDTLACSSSSRRRRPITTTDVKM